MKSAQGAGNDTYNRMMDKDALKGIFSLSFAWCFLVSVSGEVCVSFIVTVRFLFARGYVLTTER